MNKIWIILITLIGSVLLTLIILYNIYVPKIYHECKIDSDCMIVDVHNCCGAYPVCANTDSKPNPDFVRFTCSLSRRGSACGFPTVNGCKCENNLCVNDLSLLDKRP